MLESNASNVDLDITDPSGNVILRLADGHIQTKEFDSSDLEDLVSDKLDAPETAGSSGQVLGLDNNLNPVWVNQSGGGNSDTEVRPSNAADVDLDVTDIYGNVIARFSGGHIKTKEFDSSELEIHNVPSGGSADYVLAKNSNTDYDLKWIRRQPIRTRMEFGAHNGAEYYAPECTVPAYRIAGQQGWEWAWIAGIDFSTDGTMYVIHDDYVDRTTDGTGLLREMTDAQINALNITQTGSGYNLSDFDPSELKIPTLEQVVQQCVRYGMKMVMRLSLFPNGTDTEANKAKWDAFMEIINGYGIQPEDISCYLDTGTKAGTCRTLIGDDVEISTHLGLNATAADFVDWFESRSITGRKAAILSYQSTSLEAVKLLHSHGIRVYSYGANSETYASNCASWGVDIYQNGRIYWIND